MHELVLLDDHFFDLLEHRLLGVDLVDLFPEDLFDQRFCDLRLFRDGLSRFFVAGPGFNEVM